MCQVVSLALTSANRRCQQKSRQFETRNFDCSARNSSDMHGNSAPIVAAALRPAGDCARPARKPWSCTKSRNEQTSRACRHSRTMCTACSVCEGCWFRSSICAAVSAKAERSSRRCMSSSQFRSRSGWLGSWSIWCLMSWRLRQEKFREYPKWRKPRVLIFSPGLSRLLRCRVCCRCRQPMACSAPPEPSATWCARLRAPTLNLPSANASLI